MRSKANSHIITAPNDTRKLVFQATSSNFPSLVYVFISCFLYMLSLYMSLYMFILCSLFMFPSPSLSCLMVICVVCIKTQTRPNKASWLLKEYNFCTWNQCFDKSLYKRTSRPEKSELLVLLVNGDVPGVTSSISIMMMNPPGLIMNRNKIISENREAPQSTSPSFLAIVDNYSHAKENVRLSSYQGCAAATLGRQFCKVELNWPRNRANFKQGNLVL